MCGPASVRGFVSGAPPWGGMTSLGWESLGVLELTALPSIGEERWVPWVREADALGCRRAHLPSDVRGRRRWPDQRADQWAAISRGW